MKDITPLSIWTELNRSRTRKPGCYKSLRVFTRLINRYTIYYSHRLVSQEVSLLCLHRLRDRINADPLKGLTHHRQSSIIYHGEGLPKVYRHKINARRLIYTGEEVFTKWGCCLLLFVMVIITYIWNQILERLKSKRTKKSVLLLRNACVNPIRSEDIGSGVHSPVLL